VQVAGKGPKLLEGCNGVDVELLHVENSQCGKLWFRALPRNLAKLIIGNTP
jgi:hypothetical protein